jgi:S-adenosylmethionine hydrolase
VSLITLISDYGVNTYYVASIKAAVIESIPDATIIDVSHQIPSYDLLQAAFILQNCLSDFKTKTVHIVAIDTSLQQYQNVLIGQIKNNWIITADNGFLSMLSTQWDVVYKLKSPLLNIENKSLSPEKDIFVPAAKNIIQNVPLDTFADITTEYIKVANLQPVFDEMQLRATIVHVDGYDNAVTNLNKPDFEAWIGASSYRIYYKRKEYLEQIERDYSSVTPGSGLALFNSKGWLEIAINRGQGKSLLGLKLGDQIIIEKIND